jgi:hypothetical protein
MCLLAKTKTTRIEREIDGNRLTQEFEPAEDLAAYFKGVSNNHCMSDISTTFGHLIHYT